MDCLFAKKPALSLRTALKYSDPNFPIQGKMRCFYVRRKVKRKKISTIAKIKKHLLEESDSFKHKLDPPKLLFTGHRGCGKATELIKLSKSLRIKHKFHVRFLSANDLATIEPKKLLIEILKKINEVAIEEKISSSKEVETFINFTYGWRTDIEISGPISNDIVDTSVIDLGKQDESSIKIIKKKPTTPGTKIILKMIAQITDQIYRKRLLFKKAVLIIVTDLDKIDQETALSLFRDSALILTNVNCFIIYTFPLELHYHPAFPQIHSNFSDIYYLRAFNLNSKCPCERELISNYENLGKILTNRIDEFLFKSPSIIYKLIRYSGGLPSVLLNLVKHCCLISLRKKRGDMGWRNSLPIRRISENILYEVIEEIKASYLNTLSRDQFDILRYVNNYNDFPDKNDNNFINLIQQSLIIQYGPYGLEKQIWYDVNPIVKELLPKLPTTEE